MIMQVSETFSMLLQMFQNRINEELFRIFVIDESILFELIFESFICDYISRFLLYKSYGYVLNLSKGFT